MSSQDDPHNGVKPKNSSNFHFNMITLRIGPFWVDEKKFFFWSKNFRRPEPGWPHNGVKPKMSSNFHFNMITLQIGPFWVDEKKFFFWSKNFLRPEPGWPHNGKKIWKIFIADFCELKHIDSKNAKKFFRISENFSDNAEKPRITSNISTSWKGLELRSFASARYRSPLHSEAKWTKSLL